MRTPTHLWFAISCFLSDPLKASQLNAREDSPAYAKDDHEETPVSDRLRSPEDDVNDDAEGGQTKIRAVLNAIAMSQALKRFGISPRTPPQSSLIIHRDLHRR
jgi:hypothetical protein